MTYGYALRHGIAPCWRATRHPSTIHSEPTSRLYDPALMDLAIALSQGLGLAVAAGFFASAPLAIGASRRRARASPTARSASPTIRSRWWCCGRGGRRAGRRRDLAGSRGRRPAGAPRDRRWPGLRAGGGGRGAVRGAADRCAPWRPRSASACARSASRAIKRRRRRCAARRWSRTAPAWRRGVVGAVPFVGFALAAAAGGAVLAHAPPRAGEVQGPAGAQVTWDGR